MPKPLDMALFVREFRREVRGPGSPGSVQRAALEPLAWIGRRIPHRSGAARCAPDRVSP